MTVVTTWEYPPTLGWAPPYPSDFDPNEDARKAQDETVAAVLGADRSLVAKSEVAEGHPAYVLTEASRGAELLVVGSRGHGAFTGMLLGSVSEYCASHASCPAWWWCATPRTVRSAPVGRHVERWRIRPGVRVHLADHDPGSTEGAPGNKAKTEDATVPLHDELYAWQDRLWAESKRSLLVVLQEVSTPRARTGPSSTSSGG